MKIKQPWWIMIIVVVAVFLVAACGSSSDEGAATVDPDRVQSAQTVFAADTPTPRARPTATPIPDIEVELARTASRLASAVLNQDENAYMELLVQDDPLFLKEQHAWAQAWLEQDFEAFEVRLSSIQAVDEQTAMARMSMEWTQGGPNRDGKSGGATITARFVRPDPDSTRWLYAGEAWEIVRVYWDGTNWITVWPGDEEPQGDAEERIRVYYFPDLGAIEGTRAQAETLLQEIPGYYNVILDEFDLSPEDLLHIKYYDSTFNLRTMTRIGLANGTILSNQIGQSIKIAVLGPSDFPATPPNMVLLMTEALLNQIVTMPEDYPQWLVQGAGWFVFGSHYQTQTWRNNMVEQVAAQFVSEVEANPDLSLLQSTPDPITGYVLLMYVDDMYGSDLRNQWLKAIVSGEMDFEGATESLLAIPFDELESEWENWVISQLPENRN